MLGILEEHQGMWDQQDKRKQVLFSALDVFWFCFGKRISQKSLLLRGLFYSSMVSVSFPFFKRKVVQSIIQKPAIHSCFILKQVDML